MKKITYKRKYIMIRVMASSTTKDSLVTQEALKTWNYIYRQKAFKSNVQRGVHWQTILQHYLLKHAFDEKQEEEKRLQTETEEKQKMEEHQKKIEKEKQKTIDQIKQQEINFIQNAIKIKLEPNTTLTEITSNKNDEDSIETIMID
jgi:hypothetical protein